MFPRDPACFLNVSLFVCTHTVHVCVRVCVCVCVCVCVHAHTRPHAQGFPLANALLCVCAAAVHTASELSLLIDHRCKWLLNKGTARACGSRAPLERTGSAQINRPPVAQHAIAQEWAPKRPPDRVTDRAAGRRTAGSYNKNCWRGTYCRPNTPHQKHNITPAHTLGSQSLYMRSAALTGTDRICPIMSAAIGEE